MWAVDSQHIASGVKRVYTFFQLTGGITMSRSLKKIVAFAFVLTFTFGIIRTSVAQETDNSIIRPITKAGSAAMIFDLAGIGTFGFTGPNVGPMNSAVGMKYFLSDDMALFVLLGFNSMSGNPALADTTSQKPSSTKFGIGAGIQAHMRPLYSTSPYIGGIISFADSSFDNGASGNFDQKGSATTFTVAALAGFDWFFTRGLCLGGQVSLGFSSTSTSSTGPDETGSKSVTSSGQSVTQIALVTNAGVHLNVYF